MPSERAALIKQRQQEALQRQKQEIAERDAIRKQQELGVTSHSLQQNNATPQTLHDLFNSRYKPTPNQAPQINNNPENARLRAYEQKRARFLARKHAEMQQSQPQTTQQQFQPIHHPTFNTQHEQLSYNPNNQIEHAQPNHLTQNVQPPPNMQSFLPNPPTQQLQNVPPTHNLQNFYEEPSPKYITSEKNKSNINDNYNNEYELRKQTRAEQEQYRQQLLEQMQEHENKNKYINNKTEHNEYFASMSPNELRDNEKELKRAKQEKYRQELTEQMRQRENKNQSINKISEPKSNINNFYDTENELRKQKKAKQEKYRQELMEQMRQHENKNKHVINNEYFGSISPLQSGLNDKELKRAKQEKYRQELLKQQMIDQQMKNDKSIHKKYPRNNNNNNNASPYKLFDNNEKKHINYDYAKQLEEQVKLKELEKMAQKEKKLLEDRKMLMGGGFLDGFGKNPMKLIQPPNYSPQINSNLYPSKTPRKYRIESGNDLNLTGLAIGYDNNEKKKQILDKKALYKMELDRQCKQQKEKKMKEKLQAENQAIRLEEKIKKDREQLLKEKYREDLQQQMKDKQKIFNNEKDMKLELNSTQNIKSVSDNLQNSGIFGKDKNMEKLQKARKQELYQQELKQQAIEAKRKKMEKEREEKEKERQLELKIQKELDELQKKYQREKEIEAMNMSNLSNIGNGVPNIPIVKKPSNVNRSILQLSNNVSNDIIPEQTSVNKSPNIGVFKNMNMSNTSFLNHKTNQQQPLSARTPIIENKINDIKRPSTSKKMYQELLNLKKDLLQNQMMIREELQMHKQQIHQQIADNNNDKLEENKSKTFSNEMSKISNEIENLKNVLLKQQRNQLQQSPIINVMENNKNKSEFVKINDDELSLKNIIDKSSQFIPCSVPQTPMIRPDTNLSLSTTNTNLSVSNNISRMNTGVTQFGVDEYLINECKKNNEYLYGSHNNNNARLHTPNIFKIDSVERDLKQTFDYSNNMCEKSIKSKSDFVYNMIPKQNMNAINMVNINENNNNNNNNDNNQKSSDSIVNKLLLKNKNRLNYFRSTTPLDSTRSMKIGLQKIEDLLSEKLNISMNNKSVSNDQAFNIDYDTSLHELI